MSYSFKDYVDYVIDPSNKLTIEEFENLPMLNISRTKSDTVYSRVQLDPNTNNISGYTRYVPKGNTNINQIYHNEPDNMFGVYSAHSSILFRQFFNQEMLSKYIDFSNKQNNKSIMFDIDGNILYSNLENFSKINIHEIDEEMDLYLTLKYLNN